MKLINHLKTIRINTKLSQEELAHRCQISLSAYTRIEKGTSNPKLITALKIAKILGVSVGTLFKLSQKDVRK